MRQNEYLWSKGLWQNLLIFSGSGAQLGRLEDCSDAQYTALKSITLDPAAYGSVGAWTAADVTELKYVLGMRTLLNYNPRFEPRI